METASERLARIETPSGHSFGTFEGVFTPSILTIFGVIMFLRTGFVVGQAGLTGAALVLLAAEAIVFLTALSIAAIATNTLVSGGGAYFLISRVLGPASGGAVGVTLFAAQALSVSFYILGFAEAVTASIPGIRPYFVVFTLGTAGLLFVINLVGADWSIRAQYVILAVLVGAIVVMLGGAARGFELATLQANVAAEYSGPEFDFWVVFAIFFPAVTGIMTGVNMSGDLRDPSRSLVVGTLAAVAVGGVVYLIEMVLLAGAYDRAALIERPYEVLLEGALFGAGPLVAIGMYAAAISSALGSFLGAPRVLQALARDRLVPGLQPFAKGEGDSDEPRRALWLTFAITIGVLLFAGFAGPEAFNLVAEVIAMFFLGTYGIVNVAAFVERASDNPSFRPRFKFFHWGTALLGALGCGAAMLLINAWAALAAFLTLLTIYAIIDRRNVEATFGDARRGFVYAGLRTRLLTLRDLPQHPKNWRPTLLVLSGNPHLRKNLIRYAEWIEGGRGIVSLVEIITHDVELDEQVVSRQVAALARLTAFVKEGSFAVFPEVVVTADFDEGLRVLMQAHSIGPIKANVVMMGWPRDRARVKPFARHLRDVRRFRKSVVALIDRGLPERRTRRVDVWWRGLDNGSLMLILAHLLRLNYEWARAELRILRFVSTDAEEHLANEELTAITDAARIVAEVKVVVGACSFREMLCRHSKDASLVMLGFQPPDDLEASEFFLSYERTLKGLPTTMLVSSTGEADLLA